MDLQSRLGELRAKGLGVAAISYDPVPTLDPQGKVVSRFFEDYCVERATFSNILLKLDGGTTPVTATKISGSHVDITTQPSDTSVAAGNRFSLAMNVVPHAGVHVYAPGASGYRVIGVTVKPQPFVRVLPPTYPKSDIYFFKPLNQRVPVFQRPFTLTQELVIEGTSAAQAAFRGKESMTIEGSLDYQACDDKVCFNPVSVPLTWTMSLKALVTERAPQRQP